MKKLLIVLVCLGFLLSSIAFADTITIKSGKTIEGKIVERTDEYIKIDFHGVPIIYYLDEIESIDGEIRAPYSTESSSESNNERQRVLEFINKLDSIQDDSRQRMKDSNTTKLFNKAMNKEEYEKAKKITLDQINIIKQGIKQIEELSTPESCRKLKELAIKFEELAIEAKMGVIKTIPGGIEGLKGMTQTTPLIKQQMELHSKFWAEKDHMLQEYNIDSTEYPKQ